MKLYLSIVLLTAFISLSLGQTPDSSPEKTKTFGSSLEKYTTKKEKDKKQSNSQPNQKIEKSDDSDVVQIKTDLVVNDVLVTDQNGKTITELKKDDFVITEDGTPQTVEVFSRGEKASVPRLIVLIIHNKLRFQNFMESFEAAKALVDKLNPNDKMAIVRVDVKLLVDFTSDKTLLKKTLDSLKTAQVGRNKTETTGLIKHNEFETLLAVLNEMFVDENSQRIVIFQSVGDEIVTLRPDKDAPYKISKSTKQNSRIAFESERKFGFSEIKEAIEKSRATIYSIIPVIKFLGFSKKEQSVRAKILLEKFNLDTGVTDNFERRRLVEMFQPIYADWMPAAQTAMSKVAELSGGSISFIEKPEDAETVYSNIFTTIENRYVIGYYPTNQEQDGKLRRINIEVKGHPEYIITGRKSYLP